MSSEATFVDPFEGELEHLVTTDGAPVDSFESEKQMRLLTEPLHSSWSGGGRKFVAAANVGVFLSVRTKAIVPDVFLSMDVELPPDLRQKANHSYFVWRFKKPPDAVIEVVSNTDGHELDLKLAEYARMGVRYYAVFDPEHHLLADDLEFRVLVDGEYVVRTDLSMPDLGLGLCLWEGRFEGLLGRWLRWCDAEGRPIPTGAERAEQAQQRVEQAQQRAEQALQRADQERERAERLAARLRALGEDPD